MRVWTIANQKGGVGKTTTTLALGALLAASGRRVLMIDLDPHASLSHALQVPIEPAPLGSNELFAEVAPDLETLCRDGGRPGLTLLAAQPALATLEKRSAGRAGLGTVLTRALAGLQSPPDHVLIDCPPTLGILMVNALAAADRLLIPTQTEPLALHGLDGMVRTAQMIARSRNRALPFDVLPTLHDRRPRVAQEAREAMLARYPDATFPDVIPLDTRLREPDHLLAGNPAGTRGLAAYAAALAWLVQRDTPAPTALEPAA